MKLGNFFNGNILTLSQSPHGVNQSGKAIDCVPTSGTRVIAPCDMEIYYRKNDLGHQSYSYARGDGWRIIFVHCIIEKQGHVKRGTDIGYLHTGGAVHLHVAIEVNGTWDVPLNYLDRKIELRLTAGFKSQHWKDWSTWKDLHLKDPVQPQWCISSADKQKAHNQLLPYLQRERQDVINNTADQVAWWVLHGTKELPDLVASLRADIVSKGEQINSLKLEKKTLESTNNQHQSMVDQLRNELEISAQTIKDLNHKLLVAEQEVATQEPRMRELEKVNRELESRVSTLTAQFTSTERLLKQCRQNQKGTDITKTINAFFDWLSKRLKK